jgi:hypothetical protein
VKNPGQYSRLSLEEREGRESTMVSPKNHFFPELHKKTHFNAAQALMMQYPKSSLRYEGDQLNKELGKGPIFPMAKPFGKYGKGSNSTVNEHEELGGDITNMSKTINSIFNKTGLRDASQDMSRSTALKDFSKVIGEGQDRSRPMIPQGFGSVTSSQ